MTADSRIDRFDESSRVARKRALWHTADESKPNIMPNRSVVDALAFSSLLAAGVGFALCFAISLSFRVPDPWHGSFLVGIGAFIIYNLDRLRDTRRDRSTSPSRTEFVERNRGGLTLAVAIAAILFGGLLSRAPHDVAWLCVAIGGVGFFHRRLKRGASIKALYVSLAWLLACVGIPWLAAGRPAEGFRVAAILFPTLLANLMASNLRDNEHQILRSRPGALLSFARLLTVLGLGLAFFAGPPQRALFWIPLAELISLFGFRKDERYGLLVIDGALLAGSLLAIAHLSLA